MNKKEIELLHKNKMEELAYERETELILLETDYRLKNMPQQQAYYYPQQQQQQAPQYQEPIEETPVEKSKAKYNKGGKK